MGGTYESFYFIMVQRWGEKKNKIFLAVHV